MRAAIALAFTAAFCVGLTFFRASGTKTEIADIRKRIDFWGIQTGGMKDGMESQAGKASDIGRSADNLSNSVFDRSTRITRLQYQQ